MTEQTKRFIELADVLGLQFQCNKCGTSMFLPLNQTIDERKLRACPHCGRPWLSLPGSTTIELAVANFVNSVKELASHFDGSSHFPVGCSLSLEIAKSKDGND